MAIIVTMTDKTFEYSILRLTDPVMEFAALTKLGEEGWEVITCYPTIHMIRDNGVMTPHNIIEFWLKKTLTLIEKEDTFTDDRANEAFKDNLT
jgi:hypothetical protein